MSRRRISDPFVVVVRRAGFQIVPSTIWLTTVADTLYWPASVGLLPPECRALDTATATGPPDPPATPRRSLIADDGGVKTIAEVSTVGAPVFAFMAGNGGAGEGGG